VCSRKVLTKKEHGETDVWLCEHYGLPKGHLSSKSARIGFVTTGELNTGGMWKSDSKVGRKFYSRNLKTAGVKGAGRQIRGASGGGIAGVSGVKTRCWSRTGSEGESSLTVERVVHCRGRRPPLNKITCMRRGSGIGPDVRCRYKWEGMIVHKRCDGGSSS
jgi:hypothetical protein